MEVRQLAQAATRRMALALAGLTAIAGLLHLSMVVTRALPWITLAGLAGALGLLVLARWLSVPRSLASINGAAGTCALMASATSLLLLGGSHDIHHTLDLMLVLVGAGYFLHSRAWYLLTCALTGAGWGALMLPTASRSDVRTFAVALILAGLMGWLLNRSRRRVLQEFGLLHARDRARELQLREALEGIRTLRGLVPICAQCKKIRDDQGYWQQVETYVRAHSEAEFTHSLCPTCTEVAKAEWESILPPTP